MSPLDEALVTRASRRTARWVAALVVVIIGVLSAATLIVVLHNQSVDRRALLADTIAQADDVEDPPAHMWLVISAGGSVDMTRGIPAYDKGALTRSERDGRTRTTSLSVHDTELVVRTQRLGSRTVQAVLDTVDEERQRHQLYIAVALVAGFGIVAAAAAGRVLGRRGAEPLADALRRQERFVADASHELRTPLTVLSTRAQVLARELQREGSPHGERAEALVVDVSRMTSLMDELLDASDPRRDGARSSVELLTLCRSAAASTRSTTVDVVCTGPAVTVHASAGGVERILASLVDNAIDHATSSVTLSTSANGELGTVVVSDDGPGVAIGDREAIFERFASSGGRGDRRHYGLGLALARDVASRQGGRLSVRAEGFVLELPLQTDQAVARSRRDPDRMEPPLRRGPSWRRSRGQSSRQSGRPRE